MKENMEKYARVILKTCLQVEENQPLFISANMERLDFVRIVANEAYKLGVKDIYFDLSDPVLKHDMILNLGMDDLKKSGLWNKEKWNEYAKKGGAFLMLASENPGLMKDIDPKKLNELVMYAYDTRKEFDDLRDKSIVPWCIALVPTLSWSKQVFGDRDDSLELAWSKIFEICGINTSNPEELIQRNIDTLDERSNRLNDLKIKKLTYKNSLGTDFSIELNEKTIWCSGGELLQNGKKVLVNFPTYEIFTSPNMNSANGVVYSSKPLSYQDNIIDEFWIKFENGKVVDYDAKKGKEILGQMINSCDGANYLGEVALVPYASPISESNIIFFETLFDENASCHLALGASFPECIENGTNMSKEELINSGLNQSNNHVDFMIGTKDLNIIASTYDGKVIEIFKDGNFTGDLV